MSIVVSQTVRRWLVPASAALAVIGGGVAIGAITNAADPALPPRTAAELLVDLQTARVDGLSGTVVARADLGLPALPSARAGSPDLFSLLSGTHTLRVWYAGPNQARVALLDTLGETDVITNGTDVWIWSSRDNTATHATIPAGAASPGGTPFPIPSAGGLGLTPRGHGQGRAGPPRTVHRGHHERLGVGGRAGRVRAGARPARPGLPDRLDPPGHRRDRARAAAGGGATPGAATTPRSRSPSPR